MLYHFIENGLYRPLSKTAFFEDFLLYFFIEIGLYQGFFALLLYRKWPLSAFIKNGFFHLIDLSKTAFISLYKKQPFVLYRFIQNGLYWPLSAFIKKGIFRFIKNSLFPPLQAFIYNGLYQWLFALSLYWEQPLSRIFHFIALSQNGLYRPLSKMAFFAWLLYRFINNGLYQPLLKMAFFALSLYLKQPLSITVFFALSLYQKWPLSAFVENGLFEDFLLIEAYTSICWSGIFCFRYICFFSEPFSKVA